MKKSATIKQAELKEYLRLAEAERRRDAMRKDLMARLDGGAKVQPGPLTALIEVSTAKRLSRGLLVELIGAEETDALMERVPHAEQRSLRVRAAEEMAAAV